ncbi:vomeronasal type-2 receptor 26-like [Leptodactylus fuscus]
MIATEFPIINLSQWDQGSGFSGIFWFMLEPNDGFGEVLTWLFVQVSELRDDVESPDICNLPLLYYYENLLAFFYTVDEINKNPSILPNLTLGYHIYDSCADPRKAVQNILQILSGPGNIVPNYSCTKKKVVGFIGDHFSSTTLSIAHLLGIYPYSQISYGATDTLLSDKHQFPSVFRALSDDYTIFAIICHFLSYFEWTWVGIVASDDDTGLKEASLLTKLLTSHEICLAFVLKCDRSHMQRNIEIPRSKCSESCLPGHRKLTSSSIHLCCYDCAPCSEGEIANISDSENCMKCPEDSWPNENRTFCVLKEMEYLSYTEDILSSAFSCLSSFFCILTILIFAMFVSKRDTPIVRANNKNLSFVLLVSIMLSFLCVFLFLGRPVDITCMLRQISAGILLSVSISSLLAKTIMVCIAFKATKPGSVWRTWTGVKLPNSVLLICSSVQVVLCMSWVTLSPPFQELDTHSYKEKTVVQCNEGSDLWFYSVLGYMGILAAISFIIAFLVRTLPDSFNEAKYITFSMLVFCSVWIAMIPAYLSTKGKYMVAVEIFAILTSNAGLLGCIFVPKCYIILFKPQLNTRKHLLDR